MGRDTVLAVSSLAALPREFQEEDSPLGVFQSPNSHFPHPLLAVLIPCVLASPEILRKHQTSGLSLFMPVACDLVIYLFRAKFSLGRRKAWWVGEVAKPLRTAGDKVLS